MTRFFAQYEIIGNKKLPIDYRSAFMSLIKTALDVTVGYTSEIFQKTPVCIAIRFDKKPDIINDSIMIGNTLRLYISTPDKKLAADIYNGLLKNKTYTIYDLGITKPNFVYLNEYRFFKHQTKMFYTLSPIVIRNCKDKTKYVTPTDEDFDDSFTNALKEQWLLYNNTQLNDISFKIIKYNKVAMTHYGGLVLGFTGLLAIEADANVLNFFYQSGIGHRRSNGFGFVEIDR